MTIPRDQSARAETAVVLAAFGSTDPTALEALFHIAARFRAAFPEREVRLTFTSRFVRRFWRKRGADRDFRAARPDFPEEVFEALSPLGVLAALQEDGPRPVAVQSLHVTEGHEYRDLANLAAALDSIRPLKPENKPYPSLVLSPPALGLGDGEEGCLVRAAAALEPLVREARRAGAALVLAGHGQAAESRPDSLGGAYGNLLAKLRALYGPGVHLGLVEGGPGPRELAAGLGPGRIQLAPLLVTAGEHLKKDLAGDGPDSWASVFRAAGHDVSVRTEGLGSLDGWADLYVENLRRTEARQRL